MPNVSRSAVIAPEVEVQTLIDPSKPSKTHLGTLAPSRTSKLKPRFIAKINNDVWDEIVHVQIDNVGLSTMSSFVVDAVYTRAAGADIGVRASDDSRLNRLFNLHTQSLGRDYIEIHAGYVDEEDPSIDALDLVFSGVIDRVQVDITRNCVSIIGRDYSAIFQESSIHAQFRNQTVSGAVKEIAERYEFKLVTIPTSTKLGTIFELESIDVENIPIGGLNVWELLTKFADFDGYKIFCIGRTLYYLPYESFQDTITFELGDNVEVLELDKNYSISSSRVNISFFSTNMKTKESLVSTVGPGSGAGSKGDLVNYTILTPPNTPPEVLDLASTILGAQLAQLEHQITIHCTGAPQQSVLNKLKLDGTGTIFDREYRIARVRWDMGFDAGWQAEINALSLPPEARLHSRRVRQRLGVTSSKGE